MVGEPDAADGVAPTSNFTRFRLDRRTEMSNIGPRIGLSAAVALFTMLLFMAAMHESGSQDVISFFVILLLVCVLQAVLLRWIWGRVLWEFMWRLIFPSRRDR